MNQLSEVTECGEQLLAVLVGDTTETATWKDIHEKTREVADLRQKQQKQLKEAIQYLTSEVNMPTDSADTDKGISSSVHDIATMETSLLTQVDTTRSQCAVVVRECEQMKQELTKAQEEQQVLKDQRQSQKEAKTAALPLARCDVNLYSNITNLRWQFNCAPHEVRGYICNNNDVKTFSLNSHEVSRFFITNHLWDLIEEDW